MTMENDEEITKELKRRVGVTSLENVIGWAREQGHWVRLDVSPNAGVETPYFNVELHGNAPMRIRWDAPTWQEAFVKCLRQIETMEAEAP